MAQNGLLVPGNIDTSNIAPVANPAGGMSTVYSASFGTPDGEVLVPRVVGGKVVSNEDALKEYQRTGRHLGIFDTPANATAYAESLHQSEAKRIMPSGLNIEQQKAVALASARLRLQQSQPAQKPQGVTDNRTAGQVAKDQIGNVVQGAGQFVTGIPSMISSAAGAASDLARGDIQGLTNRSSAALSGLTTPLKNLGNDAMALFSNKYAPSSQQEQQQYANLAGQNAAGTAIGAGASKYSELADALRTGANAVTTPEARMAAATSARANATPISGSLIDALKSAGNVNPLNAATSLANAGMDLGRNASAPINEALARFMANGKPYGQNTSVPTWTDPDLPSEPQAQRPPSASTMALRDALEKQRVASVAKAEADSRMSPQNMNRPAANSTDPNFPINSGYQPPSADELSAALEKHRQSVLAELQAQPAPPSLDAPTVNKWMGVKTSQMMRGADPGARLISENLIGPDKATTAANVDSALGQSGSQLGKLLDSADKTGVTINAKNIIDTSIADATKKFGVKSDEAFMKQIEQISTDAASEFSDLDKLSPSQAFELKKRIGNSVRFDANSAPQSEVNALLKNVYGQLNDQIKKAGPGMGDAQARWGDLYQASKTLKESLVKDRAGRGSGAASPIGGNQ